MPLIESKPGTHPVQKPTPIRITDPEYRGVTVDTRYIPTSALLTAIEGSSWKVNYYSQVIDSDNDLNGQLVNREAILQQYKLVIGFELKVTTPLTQIQNSETKEFQVNGAANVYPFLVPNVGDMFLADVGDGREGIFRVTSSERRSFFKDTSHYIEYELIDYSTETRRQDLQSKTIKTLYYLRDFLYYGQNPLVEEEDYHLIQELGERYITITKTYFNRFFSNEFQSMMLPGQILPMYDHYLVKAIKANFNTDEAVEVQYIRAMNVADDDAFKAYTIWDAILLRDKDILLHIAEKAGVVSCKSFTREPLMESIYHSGFQYVVYPIDAEVSVDYDVVRPKRIASTGMITDVPGRDRRMSDLVNESLLDGLPYTGAPLINQITKDDYYVFSEAFYTRAERGQSKLELAVRDHINGQYVDRRLLKAFCDTYHAWGGLERFYFTPILLMLMKGHIRSV